MVSKILMSSAINYIISQLTVCVELLSISDRKKRSVSYTLGKATGHLNMIQVVASLRQSFTQFTAGLSTFLKY